MMLEYLAELSMKIPVIAGASLLIADDKDIRSAIAGALCLAILFLLILQGFGIDSGNVGATVTSAFMLLLGYYFGKKETEVKQQ